MYEETLKTPIPKCYRYSSFLFGVVHGVAILWVLNLVRNRVFYSCRMSQKILILVYLQVSTQPINAWSLPRTFYYSGSASRMISVRCGRETYTGYKHCYPGQSLLAVACMWNIQFLSFTVCLKRVLLTVKNEDAD